MIIVRSVRREGISAGNASGFDGVWSAILNASFSTESKSISIDTDFTVMLTIFRKGPFRIAYCNFPFGFTRETISDEFVSIIREQTPGAVMLLNIVVSGFVDSSITYPVSASVPETKIKNLDEHNIYEIKKVRKDLNRAKKFDFDVVAFSKGDSYDDIYNLYSDTISRKQGNLRYNKRYFELLCGESLNSSDIHVFKARRKALTAGYLILILRGKEAFYLHGGVDVEFAKFGISDRLIEIAISVAKEHGCESFNFMASPEKQPSLVKFKEKWGGVTLTQNTYSVVLHLPLYSAYKILLPLYNFFSHAFR